jgi:hypothetical protein
MRGPARPAGSAGWRTGRTSDRPAGQELAMRVEQDGGGLWFVHVYPQPLQAEISPTRPSFPGGFPHSPPKVSLQGERRLG